MSVSSFAGEGDLCNQSASSLLLHTWGLEEGREIMQEDGVEGAGREVRMHPDMVTRFKTFPHEQSACWQPPTSVEFRLLL